MSLFIGTASAFRGQAQLRGNVPPSVSLLPSFPLSPGPAWDVQPVPGSRAPTPRLDPSHAPFPPAALAPLLWAL
jgi:hypothetical protein